MTRGSAAYAAVSKRRGVDQVSGVGQPNSSGEDSSPLTQHSALKTQHSSSTEDSGLKLWGGRFGKPTERSVEAFTSSLEVDFRLLAEDVLGSLAHAKMLARQGIISSQDGE